MLCMRPWALVCLVQGRKGVELFRQSLRGALNSQASTQEDAPVNCLIAFDPPQAQKVAFRFRRARPARTPDKLYVGRCWGFCGGLHRRSPIEFCAESRR